MATIRLSVNPEDSDHGVVQAVGAAVVTKNIEITIDVGTLAAAGLSANQIRLQTLMALEKFHAFVETSGKFVTAG
jgi:hypothetical protein